MTFCVKKWLLCREKRLKIIKIVVWPHQWSERERERERERKREREK